MLLDGKQTLCLERSAQLPADAFVSCHPILPGCHSLLQEPPAAGGWGGEGSQHLCAHLEPAGALEGQHHWKRRLPSPAGLIFDRNNNNDLKIINNISPFLLLILTTLQSPQELRKVPRCSAGHQQSHLCCLQSSLGRALKTLPAPPCRSFIHHPIPEHLPRALGTVGLYFPCESSTLHIISPNSPQIKKLFLFYQH